MGDKMMKMGAKKAVILASHMVARCEAEVDVEPSSISRVGHPGRRGSRREGR